MTFQYVWAIARVDGAPPTKMSLNNANPQRSGCEFYPFHHAGGIFTIDFRLWNIASQQESKHALFIDFFPERPVVLDFLRNKSHQNMKSFLIACNYEKALTIDPRQNVQLTNLNTMHNEIYNHKLIGYDVIDMSGLSAIADICYTAEDSALILSKKININRFGIISTQQDSDLFSNLASTLADEHAPFFSVQVWAQDVNNPEK